MPISVSWDNEQQTVIRYDFEGRWTWVEFDEAMHRCAEMIASVDGKVDVIFNLGGAKRIPEGANLHMRNALVKAPADLRYIAVASSNAVIETTFSLMARIHKPIGERMVTVATVDAARAVLAHPYTLGNSISPATF